MPRKGARTRKPKLPGYKPSSKWSSRFDKLAAKLSMRPGIYSPRGLAAAIGRKKYGSAGMAAMVAAGRRNPRVGIHQRLIELENKARHGGRPLTPLERHELRLAYDALKVPFLHRIDTGYDKRALAWEVGRHREMNPLPEGSKYHKMQPVRINEKLEEVGKDEGRLVEVISASGNAKTGPVMATSACQLSCPESCPFFTPLNRRTAGGHGREGCYGEVGNQAMIITSHLNRSGVSVGASPEDIARAEAHGIQVVLERVLKGKKKPMRLHVVGDAKTNGAARILGDACQGWPNVWTYTHAWKNVDRGAWDGISVLASCETPDEVKDAHGRGYATSVVLPIGFKSKGQAFEWNGLRIQPCWVQSGNRANCMGCKLCWQAPTLLRKETTIAFTVHGDGAKVAKQHVIDKLKADGWDPNGGGRVK
jgi:hypothetical protein